MNSTTSVRQGSCFGRRILFLCFCFAMCVAVASGQTSYSRSEELPPLRVSFADLQDTLNKAATLITSANPAQRISEQIEIGSGQLRITTSGHLLELGGAKIPQSIDRFEYSAEISDNRLWRFPIQVDRFGETSRHGEAPVTKVELSFNDYERSVKVTGTSPEQVDAIFSTIRDDLLKVSSPIGGAVIESICTTVSVGLLCGGIIWMITNFPTHNRKLLTVEGLSLVLLCELILLPKNFLAGFSAIRGDASLIVRYGPQISFWGLVTGVLGLFVATITFAVEPKPKKDNCANLPVK